MESKEGGLKRLKVELSQAERTVKDAQAAVKHMGALDAAVATLITKSNNGVSFYPLACHLHHVYRNLTPGHESVLINLVLTSLDIRGYRGAPGRRVRPHARLRARHPSQ